jgi:Holliday junction resolvasome RuvABC endonuclease subunit
VVREVSDPTNITMAIDPGIAHVGVGIVARYGAKLDIVESCHIETSPDEDTDARERRIWYRIATLAKAHRPAFVGYEDQRGVNVAARQNAQRAIAAAKSGAPIPKLGYAGGNDAVPEVVGIVKAIAWSYGATLFRYTAQQAKKAVAGDGRADKEQVRSAIRHYFKGYEQLMGRIIDLNEADAIAGAIYCERVTYLDAKRRVRRVG